MAAPKTKPAANDPPELKKTPAKAPPKTISDHPLLQVTVLPSGPRYRVGLQPVQVHTGPGFGDDERVRDLKLLGNGAVVVTYLNGYQDILAGCPVVCRFQPFPAEV